MVDQVAAGLAHEEERVGYLSNQTMLMMQILEEEGEGGKLYVHILYRGKFSRTVNFAVFANFTPASTLILHIQ